MKSKLFLIILLLSSSLFAGPSCIWDLESTRIHNIHGIQLHIDRYDCSNKDYWSPEIINDTYKASLISAKGHVIGLGGNHYYEDIDVISSTFFPALGFSRPSASNVSGSIVVYTKNGEELKSFTSPINEYQANKKKGSESKPIGFFRIGAKSFIENLRSLGGECNACQKYVVDTYEISNEGIKIIDTRAFAIDSYKRFSLESDH